jgi:hypothetical protein
MSSRDEWGNYWFPHDIDHSASAEPGCIVAYRYKPWRLISKTLDSRPDEVPYPIKRYVYVLRPTDIDPTVTAHSKDLHLSGTATFDVLLEHYGLCVHCNELLPCRAAIAAQMAKREAKQMSRYETPGICPECQEPVTHRQESETFPNVLVPLGPPVTFHTGRRKCRYAMQSYRDRAGQPDSQLRLDGGGPG